MLAEFLNDRFDEGYGMGIERDGAIVGHWGGDLGFFPMSGSIAPMEPSLYCSTPPVTPSQTGF